MFDLKLKDRKHLIAYIHLLRLHRPTGIWLLMWPSLWSIALASGNTVHLDLYAIFILGAFLMRSAGCIINDIIDREIDKRVKRTRFRPLAAGRMPLWEAWLILGVLLLASFALLLYLAPLAQWLGVFICLPIVFYPYAKRIMWWPQLVLGLTFNWGILIGWAAIRDQLHWPAILLYVASCFWTLGYDTIYAHQDKEDDQLLGVKSLAIRLAPYNKRYILLFYSVFWFILWGIGIFAGLSIFYHAIIIMVAMLSLIQISRTDLNHPGACLQSFRMNTLFGLLIFCAIIMGVCLSS